MNHHWSYICSSMTEGHEELVEGFLERAVIRELPAKAHMIRQGERADYIYLLLDGVAETYLLLDDGRKKTNMIYGSKGILGISCLDEKISFVNVKCITKVRFAAAHRREIKEWPRRMLLSLAFCQTYKMQGVYRQLREQTFLSTGEQILKFLADWEESQFESKYGLKHVKQQMLADCLGLSRVQVANTIGKLLEQGSLTEGQKQLLSLTSEEGDSSYAGQHV